MVATSITVMAKVALIAVAGAVTSSVSHANEIALSTKYRISFLGLNVGEMKNTIRLSDTHYAISGGARANSVVSVIKDVRARFFSTGEIAKNHLLPLVHTLSYRSGKKTGSLRLDYSADSVSNVEASPKIKYKHGSVPVEKTHLKNVLDPVSSLLFPVRTGDVGDGRMVCNRVLPVFDGRARMNLVFAYKSSSIRTAEGFRGETFTCSVRYKPISGIRPAKKYIKFMESNRDIEVTMARIGSSNIYGLFAFRVRTEKGVASGSAYKFYVQ